MAIRPVKRRSVSEPTLEGAGVRLRRAFGFQGTAETDPFLLLDDFRGDRPDDYAAGFPWHPHRGIETVTYVLAGTVEHKDSIGNSGTIGPGDVQWMTAGRGILHQEMPSGDASGRMYGFQLWVNLPASRKMTEPRYQGIEAADIPAVTRTDGTVVRIVCGEYDGVAGPVSGGTVDPVYLDISMPALARASVPISPGRSAFAYVFGGTGEFAGDPPCAVENRVLALFGDGDAVEATAGPDGMRFLLVSGLPLREPVAWRGPIVMNTHDELRRAYRELQEGTFLSAPSPEPTP